VASTNESDLFATPFLAPDARPALALDHRVITHDGAVTTLRALTDRPVAISFAYTRCTNPNRCPRVVATFGELREELERAGLSDRVRLLLVSYDPGYDTPVVLRSYAKVHSLRLDDRALFLQPELDPGHVLFRDLGVRASFHENGVALHGIQLLLLDKSGRLARAYHTLLWDNHQVLADLEKLANEWADPSQSRSRIKNRKSKIKNPEAPDGSDGPPDAPVDGSKRQE
jgi:cytochrome oxidase Cu insertion factor (SCO1/SenC/PrrC family)